jgi:hypothetical protein
MIADSNRNNNGMDHKRVSFFDCNAESSSKFKPTQNRESSSQTKNYEIL